MFQGFSFPALHVMISRWAPVEERSLISSIIYAGWNRNFSLPFCNLEIYQVCGKTVMLECLLYIQEEVEEAYYCLV